MSTTRQMQDVPGFVETFRVDPGHSGPPWLDCDTTPSIRGRYAKRKTLPFVISECERLLHDVEEGQIGIYKSFFGGGFLGYVIKYRGRAPYFEEPTI